VLPEALDGRRLRRVEVPGRNDVGAADLQRSNEGGGLGLEMDRGSNRDPVERSSLRELIADASQESTFTVDPGKAGGIAQRRISGGHVVDTTYAVVIARS
jgi:hypothetical protein